MYPNHLDFSIVCWGSANISHHLSSYLIASIEILWSSVLLVLTETVINKDHADRILQNVTVTELPSPNLPGTLPMAPGYAKKNHLLVKGTAMDNQSPKMWQNHQNLFVEMWTEKIIVKEFLAQHSNYQRKRSSHWELSIRQELSAIKTKACYVVDPIVWSQVSIVGSFKNSCRPLLSQQESPFTLT